MASLDGLAILLSGLVGVAVGWGLFHWLDRRFGLFTIPDRLIRAQVWLAPDVDWSSYSTEWQRAQIREAKEAMAMKAPRRLRREVARLIEVREATLA